MDKQVALTDADLRVLRSMLAYQVALNARYEQTEKAEAIAVVHQKIDNALHSSFTRSRC